MIIHTFDTEHSILYIRPTASLGKEDFVQLAATVDPYIEETGGLSGVIIEVQAFPGWENVGAFISHFRFVKEHHKLVRKIAVVTDSAVGSAAQSLASHFVSAEIKQFAAGDVEAAKKWIMGSVSASS